MTKYHENLLRDNFLSLLSVVKFFSSLETKMVLKIVNETFIEDFVDTTQLIKRKKRASIHPDSPHGDLLELQHPLSLFLTLV